MKKDSFEIKLPRFFGKIKNPWAVSTIILAVIAVVSAALLLIYIFNGSLNLGTSPGMIGKNSVDFLNSNLNASVELVNVSEFSGLYQVNVLYQGQIVPVYATKDGKYLLQVLAPMK
ncbi:MAG: hypothetical protein M1165_02170 [Candidatus Pacearchaeota archaeon]|nr:hypothetical protein [Candidatus Pacearchaeota archaeon]